MKRYFLSLLSSAIFITGASAQSINPSPYCLPAFDPTNNSGSTQNYIYEVMLGTFDNVTPTLYSGSSYVYYNNLAPLPIHVITTDILYAQMVIGAGSPGLSADAIVYIDYNHNNVFDSAEEVYQSTGYTSAASIHIPVPLPTTALYGTTRMRIQWVEGTNFSPCQPTPSDDFGAVADYDVTIPDTYPIATTTFATSLTTTGAKLNGLINANYSAHAVDSFQYGTTTAYGTTVATASVWSLTDSTVSTVITGLTHGTTYHYRVKSTNANGTNYGRDTTFTTPTSAGISNPGMHLQVNVYPNPANDIVHIDNLREDANYSIQNIAGVTVKRGVLLTGNNDISINTLPSGNYILEVFNNLGEKNTIKLTK